MASSLLPCEVREFGVIARRALRGVRHGRRVKAEDCVAEGVEACWLKREKYDPSKGERGRYFYTVARNAMIRFVRQSQVKTEPLEDVIEGDARGRERVVAGRVTHKLLFSGDVRIPAILNDRLDLLEHKKPAWVRALRARLERGLTWREIAKEEGITRQAAMVWAQRAARSVGLTERGLKNLKTA